DDRNVYLVLASPHADSEGDIMDALPGAEGVSPGHDDSREYPAGDGRDLRYNVGGVRFPRGVFVADAGLLVGPLTVDLASRQSPLATDGSQPSLLAAAQPTVPAGWRESIAKSGQSERQQDGSWSGDRLENYLGAVPGKVTCYVRCYGGGT